jgi:hypothetical protein
MKNFYYSIISSSLVGAKSSDPSSYITTSYIAVSIISCLNFFTINMLLNAVGICDILNIVEVDIISKKSLVSGQVHGLLNFGVISLLIHYFLFFYKKNYTAILKKFPQKNGKLMIYYITISLVVMIITGILLRWLSNIGVVEDFTYMKPIWVLILF